MNDPFLQSRLDRVADRYRWLATVRLVAAWWALCALLVAGVVMTERYSGRTWPGAALTFILVAVAVAIGLTIWQYTRTPDNRWLARKIEATHPELKGVLLTAIEQPERPTDFLTHRVMQEAIRRSQEQDWSTAIPTKRLVGIHVIHLAALACFLVAVAALSPRPAAVVRRAAAPGDEVVVTPGDTTLEKGEPLVIMARFGRSQPAEVGLVIEAKGQPPRTVPLARNLNDPIFGTTLPAADGDFTYRLEFDRHRTRDFRVAVFEHPRLVRADADLQFPTYTKLAPRHVEDTRRLSVIEGTRVTLELQLNKPVTRVELIARDPAKTTVTFTPDPQRPSARLSGWLPKGTLTYDLHLVDADGRTNKVQTPIVVDVQPNRAPEIKVASPRGDIRPSALEEVTFDGTVWDDFGTAAYGLAYTVADKPEQTIELGRNVPAREKQAFRYLLNLEQLGAKPDDLVSWYTWADDVGPDGQPRRTRGDLYFAEVRPFEEIFRESRDMQSDQPPGQSGAAGNQTRKLTELQKQIITATWKLHQGGSVKSGFNDDTDVVRQSEEQALGQAREAAEQAQAARQQGYWREATDQMQKAIEKLKAARDPAALAAALPPEQSAYQTLLKLQARETTVTRGRRGGGGAGQAGNQRQIDELDLQQSENRYETQRQAQVPQTEKRSQDLAIMNRLQDLARRQQDLNDRMKELQTQLQAAQSEQQRAEARERLKRLEDEQRQMLADADELRQQMNRSENQADLASQRQQLDQARDELQQAADAASGGTVAQAVASGTRAQRDLQQARDDLRRQSSNELADELRSMRTEARDVARAQEQLQQKIAGAAGEPGSTRKSLDASDQQPELANEIAQTKARWNKLLDEARKASEQAESSEPLAASQLYDSVRKVTQDDAESVSRLQSRLMNSGDLSYDLRQRLEETAKSPDGGKALDLANEMLRAGNQKAARDSAQVASAQADELRRGVERAAGAVLGDDTEQLKLARSELDQLAEQLQRDPANTSAGPKVAGDTARGGAENQRGPVQKKAGGPATDLRSAATSESARGAAETRGGSDQKQRGAGDARDLAANDGAQRSQGRTSTASGRGSGSGESDSDATPTAPRDGVSNGQRGGSGRTAMANDDRSAQRNAGSRGGRLNLDDVLDGGPRNAEGGGLGGGGPLTGGDYGPWSDRMRNVEQLIDSPALRDSLANARERLRLLRRDYVQSKQKPDWDVVRLQVVKPLLEVRDRVAEDLARHETRESLAPVDHDPVPNRFAEAVRKYYEELGRAN